jgi:SAM-dependent methyltransferase
MAHVNQRGGQSQKRCDEPPFFRDQPGLTSYNRPMTASAATPPSEPPIAAAASPQSSTAPEFPRHDPASAAFWDVRFEAAFTPWDQGGVPNCLSAFVERDPTPRRVLIPGCGTAHEVRFLVEHGWPTMAIDFSPAAVAEARRLLGPLAAQVREADFFSPDPDAPYDLIYERAFLCALPPRLRPAWAAQVAALLKTGGLLAGFFYFDSSPKGPPFGIEPAALQALLSPHFRHIETATPRDSIPVFQGKEQWQVWQRR